MKFWLQYWWKRCTNSRGSSCKTTRLLFGLFGLKSVYISHVKLVHKHPSHLVAVVGLFFSQSSTVVHNMMQGKEEAESCTCQDSCAAQLLLVVLCIEIRMIRPLFDYQLAEQKSHHFWLCLHVQLPTRCLI